MIAEQAPAWLSGDVIATRLIAMGWHSMDAYDASERCAIVAEGCRISIHEAAEQVIGFYPHSADVREKQKATPHA